MKIIHTTEIVEFKKLSNGQFAICIRCCGNPSTDSWHTMAADVMATSKKKKESVGLAQKKVAKEHDDAIKAEAAAIELMGAKEEHE